MYDKILFCFVKLRSAVSAYFMSEKICKALSILTNQSNFLNQQRVLYAIIPTVNPLFNYTTPTQPFRDPASCALIKPH